MKRQKISYGEPLYKLPLSNDWQLIITNHANKFYNNIKTNKSFWQLPNNEGDINDAKDTLMKHRDVIVCLLAMIRGVRISHDIEIEIMNVFKLEPIESKKEIKEVVIEEQEQEQEEVNVSDDNDDDNYSDLGLNSSDLEDLENDIETDDIPTIKQSEICKNFIKLLQNQQINIYSSYDLEITQLCKLPEYITNQCNTLTDETRRILFDEYCRTNVDNETVISPIISFIDFLKKFDGKLPSFYTDFNRKMRKDEVYVGIIAEISLNFRQNLYKKYIEFMKLKEDERINIVKKLPFDVTTSDELIKWSLNKVDQYPQPLFLTDDQLSSIF